MGELQHMFANPVYVSGGPCPAAASSTHALISQWALLPPPAPTPRPTPMPTVNAYGIHIGMTTPNGTPGMGPVITDLCGIYFGNSLEFLEDGTYADTAGGLLASGNYAVLPLGRLKVATQGGLSVYTYTVAADMLTIQATSNAFTRTFRYQRAP